MGLTFGVVGAGGRGKRMDHDVKRLNWLRLEALLRSDVDFVHTARPPRRHASMSIEALTAGKHVR